jgi:dynein heavy chain
VFWISGFYFTHSFLAGVKQNFARSNRYPYDRVDFKFRVSRPDEKLEGCLVTGLYLEGAGWDELGGGLCES